MVYCRSEVPNAVDKDPFRFIFNFTVAISLDHKDVVSGKDRTAFTASNFNQIGLILSKYSLDRNKQCFIHNLPPISHGKLCTVCTCNTMFSPNATSLLSKDTASGVFIFF
jgi:hypothetical protein